ncbi:protein of unknown function [Vibrio tapetis subsp. tapetis]|uniref:Uncharacterized protein n=1 Tax=Vibrio tapetis subsp. tapetis TaxID=1671868 RepID=A0A2N8ZK49_9VIBR|nr:protein of unknown function [Vibrio tapetis subsp. tapetis]
MTSLRLIFVRLVNLWGIVTNLSIAIYTIIADFGMHAVFYHGTICDQPCIICKEKRRRSEREWWLLNRQLNGLM